MIGILSLQGAVPEHQRMLSELGVKSRLVKDQSDLKSLDGLIIPGGESTAIKRLMVDNGIFETIKALIADGLPTFGTCAGMVLLSQPETFNMISARVVRNGFGRQQQSFERPLAFQGLKDPFHAVFIRAPYLEAPGQDVKTLAKIDDRVVAVSKDNVLATAFHPELTNDPRLHDYFLTHFVN